jgi:hypothetical protein
MDQLGGGIRFTATVDRRLNLDGARFAVRVPSAPGRARRSNLVTIVVVVALGALLVASARSEGDTLGSALARTAPFWVVAALVALVGNRRTQARVLAGQTMKGMPPSVGVTFRFDPDGVESRGGGIGSRFDWTAVTTVVEGDRFLAVEALSSRMMTAPTDHPVGGRTRHHPAVGRGGVRGAHVGGAAVAAWQLPAPGHAVAARRNRARAGACARVTGRVATALAPG